MMLYSLIVLGHVAAAVALFSGMVGRLVTFAQARRATDLNAALALLAASETFERRLVMPSSALLVAFGLWASLQGRWPLLGFLQGADQNWLLASLVLLVVLAPAIPVYLLPARRRREAAVEAAKANGMLTPELQAALADRGVWGYRVGELALTVVILALMVTKPF